MDKTVSMLLSRLAERGLVSRNEKTGAWEYNARSSAYCIVDVVGDALPEVAPGLWVSVPQDIKDMTYSQRAAYVFHRLDRANLAYQSMKDHYEFDGPLAVVIDAIVKILTTQEV